LRNQIQIYRRCISSYYWLDFQRHACVASLPILRRRRRDHYGHDLAAGRRGSANRWNLRLSVRPRIPKFSDNLDDRALTALGVPPEPKTFPFKLNGPSSQSKPSSLRLFWLISINFDSISTCFGSEAFAWSTRASTMSKLSCVLRTIRTPLCGQNVALAASARPSGRAMVGN